MTKFADRFYKVFLIFIFSVITGSCKSVSTPTRGESSEIISVSSVTKAGESLVCETPRGRCFNQYPVTLGSSCECIDNEGVVAGAAPSLALNGQWTDLSSIVTVYFATDRNRAKEKGPVGVFGNEKSDHLKYGYVQVSIPATHQTGYIEAPSSFVKLRFLENKDKHVVLFNTETLDKEEYFSKLQKRISNSPNSSALIFIHGFNVTFDDAALRTAQISFDLGFKGAPIFYSWPSRGSPTPLGYSNDSKTIEWSKEYLKEFLKEVLNKTEAQNVYLIAHSMGNRALTSIYSSLLEESPEVKSKVKEIILASPDLDSATFRRDIAPKMIKFSAPITIYSSSSDKALQLAHLYDGAQRVGDVGADLFVMEGFETIDATNVNTSFLGHSSFADTRLVIQDWQYIIDQGLRAPKRAGLIQPTSDKSYWMFKR